MKNSLSVSGIIKSFGNRKVLDNAYIHCESGGIVGVFGRNGSGKSTLLKIIFGTLNADEIAITINDRYVPVKQIIPLQQIAYLPQDPFLPKNLKVKDIIPMFLESGSRQDKLFYRPEVHILSERKVKELSMGQLRYLELLLISHLDHPFLMLDEPFSMVEPLYKDKIKELLLELKKEKGILLTDHYYSDILQVSDKNLLLKDGKIITINNPEELVTHGYLTAVNL